MRDFRFTARCGCVVRYLGADRYQTSVLEKCGQHRRRMTQLREELILHLAFVAVKEWIYDGGPDRDDVMPGAAPAWPVSETAVSAAEFSTAEECDLPTGVVSETLL